MQDLNPDMEELLQRASADYPLINGADRWDEIADRILQAPIEPGSRKAGNSLVKYFLFLLLMLLSFLVLNDTNPLFKENKASNKNAIESEVANANHLPFEPARRNIGLSKPQSPAIASNKLPVVNNNKIGFNKSNVSNIEMQAEISTDESKSIANTEYADESTVITNDLNKKQETSVAGRTEIIQEVKKNDEVKNIEHKITPLASAEKPGLPLKKNRSEKGFYYGLGGGIGWNAIKDQGFNNANFKAAFIAGYRINPFFSVESGISFSQKSYATTGKYFNMDEMHKANPSVTEIMDVKGSSNLFELPLMIRYDMVRKNNHRLFSTIGLSSYLITMENNYYNVMMNGTAQPMHGTYSKDKIYYTASLDFGLGFEKDFSKKTHVRLEPYLQLPIGGIGVGKLPVKTIGVRLALSRSLH
jgi:hypothetical protein